MLHKLKQTFTGQLSIFAAFLVVTWSAEFFLNMRLPLRMSFGALALGLGFVLPAALSWLFCIIVADAARSGEDPLPGLEQQAPKIAAGAVLVSGFAEEPLLRGVVLNLLRPFSGLLGAFLSAGLSFVCSLNGRRTIPLALAEAAKGLILAAAFLQSRSLFSLIVARCGSEIVLTLAVRRGLAQTGAERLREQLRKLRRG